jgi:hypothetical protein
LIVRAGISIFVKIISQSSTHTSTASNSIDIDSSLLQTVGLSSGHDAVHFGGDLGREEDENTWNGSPSLVIVDWSLNVGKWFLNPAAFKEHTKVL